MGGWVGVGVNQAQRREIGNGCCLLPTGVVLAVGRGGGSEYPCMYAYSREAGGMCVCEARSRTAGSGKAGMSTLR